MRPLGLTVLLSGIAFGLAAEWASFGADDPALAVADFAVGSVLLVCGVSAWERRRESRVGALMSLAGLTWFLGTAFEPALYLHRGPLVHVCVSYPKGRLAKPLSRIVVAAAYVDAATARLASNDALTLVLSAAVALAAIGVLLGTSGPARAAAVPALVAALAFAGVLALGAIGRAQGWSQDALVDVRRRDCIACDPAVRRSDAPPLDGGCRHRPRRRPRRAAGVRDAPRQARPRARGSFARRWLPRACDGRVRGRGWTPGPPAVIGLGQGGHFDRGGRLPDRRARPRRSAVGRSAAARVRGRSSPDRRSQRCAPGRGSSACGRARGVAPTHRRVG